MDASPSKKEMNKQRRSKKVLQIVSISLTVATLIIALIYGSELVEKADFSLSDIGLVPLTLSLLSYVFFYATLSFHWLRSCRLVSGDDISSRQWLAFFASQPYKYLPTSLFTFSFRAKYARKLGMPVKSSSFAQLLENIGILSGGFLIAGILLMIVNDQVLLVLGLGIVAGVIYRFIPNDINNLIPSKKTNPKKIISKADIVKNIALTSFAWFLAGLSFYFLNKSIGIEIEVIKAIAANAMAYSLGILAIFAPGGIGVREGVFAYFSISGAGIIAWRLVTLLVDLALGTVAVHQINKK